MKTRFEFALLLAVAGSAPMAVAAQAVANWNQTYADTGKGHRVGNPDAALKLIEFVSYTCPHCAHYAQGSEATLRLGYVEPGRASVEVRHVIRNQVDLAAALVTECGPSERFFERHRAMLLSHDTWMAKARSATPAQQARWNSGPIGQQMQAIANDLDFHAVMEPEGLGEVEINRCLADTDKARAIYEGSRANSAEFAVPGTPSFVINGMLQQGVHSWESLRPLLDAPAAN